MNHWQLWRTRIFKWEFWPWYVFYLPVMGLYLWLAIRNRSFFYFCSTNPSIEMGGLFGNKKSEIYRLLPSWSYPKTVLIDDQNPDQVIEKAQEIGFPLIAKPDVGERGKDVAKIASEEALTHYAKCMKAPFLLQAFIDYPLELGVFYLRYPGEAKGRITSIVKKEFLTVTGDGKSNIRSLLAKELRAQMLGNWEMKFAHLLHIVPTKHEKVVIEPIGNHCRGTTFLDACHLIDEELIHAFDTLAKDMDGFHYGRFDLKCASVEALKELKNFQIIELNGVNAEPAHIYQSGYSLMKAYKTIFWHYRQMAFISRLNKKRGITGVSFRDGLKKIADIRAFQRRYKNK